ncbi:hypothetical protein, partial [Streptomyces californicus]
LAAWVRLAASEVSLVEAYTLPVTVPALVVGFCPVRPGFSPVGRRPRARSPAPSRGRPPRGHSPQRSGAVRYPDAMRAVRLLLSEPR